jgi:hypothetical protein
MPAIDERNLPHPSAASARASWNPASLLDGWIDPRPLALVRVAIGVAGLLAGLELLGLASRVLAPGIIALPLVPGLPRMSAAAAPLVVSLWLALALLVALGMLLRPAALALSGLAAYTMLSEQQFYSNHLYLLILLLLIVAWSPADTAWALRRRGLAPRLVPAFTATLLQLQITAVYLFSALSKLNPIFLTGAVLAAEPGIVGLVERLPIEDGLVLRLLAAGAILAELAIVVCLWTPRLRPLAVPLGLGLHGTILATMGAEPAGGLGLLMFAVAMLAPYGLFFAPRALPPPEAIPIPR